MPHVTSSTLMWCLGLCTGKHITCLNINWSGGCKVGQSLKLCKDEIEAVESGTPRFPVASTELNFLYKVETAAKGKLWGWGTTAATPDAVD